MYSQGACQASPQWWCHHLVPVQCSGPYPSTHSYFSDSEVLQMPNCWVNIAAIGSIVASWAGLAVLVILVSIFSLTPSPPHTRAYPRSLPLTPCTLLHMLIREYLRDNDKSGSCWVELEYSRTMASWHKCFQLSLLEVREKNKSPVSNPDMLTRMLIALR